jgi:hypothetical protein
MIFKQINKEFLAFVEEIGRFSAQNGNDSTEKYKRKRKVDFCVE